MLTEQKGAAVPRKPEKSAEELVKDISTETARRKRIWRKMEAAARDAVKAVKAHARSRGIRHMDWFGWIDSEFFAITKEPETSAYVMYRDPDNKGLAVHITILSSGKLDCSDIGRGPYKGYPELTDRDPTLFKKAAVQHLMGNLNDYLKDQRAVKKKKK